MTKYLFAIIFLCFYTLGEAQTWKAPAEANQLINPLKKDKESITKGEKIFQSLCTACHGKTGRGDVPSMQNLHPKPADLTSEQVQNQSDGALFWKISEGRGLMASYKNMLSEEERWALVNFIRTLAKPEETIEKTEEDLAQNINNNAVSSTKKELITSGQTVEAFPFTVLINAKTTHIMNPKGFGLNIQHRFGATKFDEGLITNFLGLDLAANMRFAFEIPYNERLMFEIGRTRYGKFYDAGFKYLILKQTADDKIPVSVAVYENIAVTTEKKPQYSDQATFENGTPFEYKFHHRLSYDNQLIIARKFSERLSGQITFQLVWRNLMPYSEKNRLKNTVIAVPLALRYRMGIMQAVSVEIMPNNQPKNFPVSFAYEVASSGNHVFQITITNSARLLSQNLYTVPTADYSRDGLMLGFNLIRYF